MSAGEVRLAGIGEAPGVGEVRLAGIGAAPGVAIGPIWRYAAGGPVPATAPAAALAQGAPVGDAASLIHAAADAAAAELDALADRVRAAGRPDDAGIFEAQAPLAQSPSLLDDAVARTEEGADPATAVEGAAADAAAMLATLDDELLAARAADVRDVGARIARILRGEALDLPTVASIAVADDLPPSMTAEIPAGLLLGIALSGGSPTAHACILARSLGIPAVVATGGLLDAIDALEAAGRSGPIVAAIDGGTGSVVLDPGSAERDATAARAAEITERREHAALGRDRPGATADGRRVLLLANIGKPEDAPRALEHGAEGVGLFRTEFVFMSRQTAPTEAEQVEAYRRVLSAFGPDRPTVIRLADIGGDKAIPYLALAPEANPFLGVRAIRLAHASPDLLVTQLKAIWRAGAAAGVVPHVMAPMVATVDDVDLFLALRDEARAAVLADGHACADRLVCGIMVEVPAAALLAPELARRVEFFSIGTNDLTQYIMAADRGNPALAYLQDALHPAVLRAIAAIVAAADASGIPVAVCGELAGDPAGALVLVGLGVDELSADPGSLDVIREALAAAAGPDLDELGRAALVAADAGAVRRLAAGLLVGPRSGPGMTLGD
jgi:phosphoenolpyruvate-protein phosphotransferase